MNKLLVLRLMFDCEMILFLDFLQIVLVVHFRGVLKCAYRDDQYLIFGTFSTEYSSKSTVFVGLIYFSQLRKMTLLLVHRIFHRLGTYV